MCNWGFTIADKLALSSLDQLANLHFHFTSVPRCTPMSCGGSCGVEVQRNTDGDTPSISSPADVIDPLSTKLRGKVSQIMLAV